MSARTLHCWQGYRDSLEYGSDEWVASLERGDATCMLPDGHDGPHEWTPDSDIGIRFNA